MWTVRWQLAAAALVACAVLSAVVGWSANGWRWSGKYEREKAAHAATVAAYRQAEADGRAAAAEEKARLQREAQEASDAQTAEIERLRAAAARIPDVIRVRVPTPCAVPAAGGDPPAAADGAGAEAGGVLHGGPADLDIRRLRTLAREADELNAAYRAVLRACR
jgi:hypothetical protein